jgi:hypothetical protein
MNKRGMDEVVVTVLLVLLGVVAVSAVFIWGRGVFSDLTSETGVCSDVLLTFKDFCYESETVSGGTKLSLKFNVRNEKENQIIDGFSILVYDDYGNTQTVSSLETTQLAGFESKSLVADFISNTEISKATIIPQVEKENEIFSCKENVKTIRWNLMERC